MKRRNLILLATAVVAAGVWALVSSLTGSDGQSAIKGVPVRRGPLEITVLETGNLKAAKSISLRSEIEGRTTILYLIDEGEQVSAGTLLCELDTTGMVNERLSQEINVRNAESAKVKAEKALEIQRSQNESDLAAAVRQVDFAKVDFNKYLEGDWPQDLQQASDDILLAQEELKRAEDKLKWSKKLSDDGFLTRTELEADELAQQRAVIRLEQAKGAKHVLETYAFPRQRSALEADVEESDRELLRVTLQNDARLVDFESDLESKTRKHELEVERLFKIDDQIGKAKIFAPVDGMVVYAKEQGNRWSGGEPVSEGKEVRERQELITIPSANGMLVDASVHESVLEQVNVGQSVKISVDALPEREFNGRVRFKAVLPDQNSWWANPDLRVYRTEIEITDPDPSMRPGMTCSIRVLVESIQDTTYIPLQTRFFRGEQAVVFVREAGRVDMRDVTLGLYNESWIQVLDGLEEGETVLMSAPQGFDLSDSPPIPAANMDEPQMPSGGPEIPGAGRGYSAGEGVPSTADIEKMKRAGGTRPEGAEGERPRRNREGSGDGATGAPLGKLDRDSAAPQGATAGSGAPAVTSESAEGQAPAAGQPQ